MTPDRGKSYDAQELSEVRQNQCVFHIQRNIKSALELQHPGARSLGHDLLKVIAQATELWKDYQADKLSLADYFSTADTLKTRLSHHLRERVLSDPASALWPGSPG